MQQDAEINIIERVYYFTSSQDRYETDSSNYLWIFLLSILHKILSNILLSPLCPYIGEIIGDHQCGLQRNRSTINQIFSFVSTGGSNGSTVREYISSSWP
jgi:hypothetical protein